MPDWLRADWPAPEGIVAGTSLRGGGVSGGRWRSLNLATHVGDAPPDVRENRRRLRDACAFPGEPQWLDQIHGTRVVSLPTDAAAPEADAAVTRRAGIVCAVLTADCLPVVLARADGSAIGVAHAGWRGLAAGVLESTVAALGNEPDEVLAWLGPAISQASYEVGDEVRRRFAAADSAAADCFRSNAGGRWQADLYGLARQRLGRAGVRKVYGGGRCTFREHAEFFSWRRDGECGRMATFIYRR